MVRNSYGNQIIFLQTSSQLGVILPLKGALTLPFKKCLSQVGGVVASRGWKLGIPLNALPCRGQGTQRNVWLKMLTEARWRNLALYDLRKKD